MSDKDEEKAYITVKEAPSLEHTNIPQGLAGAQYLRHWVDKFHIEFDKKFGRKCKPYNFAKTRWLWKGSIASLYGDKDVNFTLFKNPKEFNAMINAKPKLFKNEAKLEAGIDITEYRMWSREDSEAKDKPKIVFVNKKSKEDYEESDVLSDDEQSKILFALLLWFCRDKATAYNIMNEKDGSVKTLDDFSGSKNMALMTECQARGMELMDKKCPLYLEVFFFKGVFQHLDHFYLLRDKHIAADEL